MKDRANVLVPLDNLLVLTAKCVRVEETTHGVATQVGTMGVHFTSPVLSLNVDEPLVDKADDLDVVGGLDELHTLEGAVRDQTGTVAGLGTPSNHLAFMVSDEGFGLAGSPQAKV